MSALKKPKNPRNELVAQKAIESCFLNKEGFFGVGSSAQNEYWSIMTNGDSPF